MPWRPNRDDEFDPGAEVVAGILRRLFDGGDDNDCDCCLCRVDDREAEDENMMTRQDYNLIAAVLANAAANAPSEDQRQGVYKGAVLLANRFADTYTNFMRDRFLGAVGVPFADTQQATSA